MAILTVPENYHNTKVPCRVLMNGEWRFMVLDLNGMVPTIANNNYWLDDDNSIWVDDNNNHWIK